MCMIFAIWPNPLLPYYLVGGEKLDFLITWPAIFGGKM